MAAFVGDMPATRVRKTIGHARTAKILHGDQHQRSFGANTIGQAKAGFTFPQPLAKQIGILFVDRFLSHGDLEPVKRGVANRLADELRDGERIGAKRAVQIKHIVQRLDGLLAVSLPQGHVKLRHEQSVDVTKLVNVPERNPIWLARLKIVCEAAVA